MSDPYDFDADLRTALGDAYAIDRELTGSGMSRVFVATEKALSRQVVVKVLPPELAAGVNRDRFRREIQLAAQLQHPHIVPLHTAGAAGDLLYFTMPFIEGESLRHAIHEGVRFTPREVVRILHDVADALAYAHSRGVIHRDIKPGNVLRSGAHAVVTDFGVAKAISAAMPAVGMTTSGMAIGTPAYMAPEQLAGDPAADYRVDIYALGLLGYELLAGEAPFKSSSPQETMAAQLTRAPESITKKRPDAPPALAALLSRCLAKNPAERPQTAAEIVSLLDELDVSSGAMAPLRAFTPTRWWVAGGALAVAALAFAMWWPRAEPSATASTVPESTVVVNQTPTLTREDSLAIAAAIQKKVGEQQAAVVAKAESTKTAVAPAAAANPTASAAESLATQMTRFVDSLRVEIQRAVLDSVARVRGTRPQFSTIVRTDPRFDSLVRTFGVELGDRTGREGPGGGGRNSRDRGNPRPPPHPLGPEAFSARAADMGPPRRLFVSIPQLSRSSSRLAPLADSLVDSVRATLATDHRYVVIPADTVRAQLSRSRSLNTIAANLDVDLFTSFQVSSLPDSTVLWQVTLRDLGAHAAYGTRTVVVRTKPPERMADLDSLVRGTVTLLKEMDRAPRREPPPGGVP